MTVRIVTPSGLARAIKSDTAKLDRACRKAVNKTARQAVKIVRSNAPVAFGGLAESVHAEEDNSSLDNHSFGTTDRPLPRTVVDAPHAAAVEIGSRPHSANIDALERWVKLRGTQGLRGGKLRGTTSRAHARTVAAQLRSMVRNGATPVDAPRVIAMMIWNAIREHGTRPHWFVRNSLPEVEALLEANINNALATAIK